MPPLTSRQANASPASRYPSSCRVHVGDLWQLGEHRLLCGDCTDAAQIARLMQSDTASGQEQADMPFLDPPYGVALCSSRKPSYGPVRPITGDNLGEYGTFDLLKRALQTVPLKPGGSFYICSAGGTNETLFRLALRDVGLPLHQSLIWVKNHFVLSRHDYHWRHEVLLYGWKPGASHIVAHDVKTIKRAVLSGASG